MQTWLVPVTVLCIDTKPGSLHQHQNGTCLTHGAKVLLDKPMIPHHSNRVKRLGRNKVLHASLQHADCAKLYCECLQLRLHSPPSLLSTAALSKPFKRMTASSVSTSQQFGFVFSGGDVTAEATNQLHSEGGADVPCGE
jgi:hypothetical protein